MELNNLLHNTDMKPTLDNEWVGLLLEAKSIGITPEEVKDFFTQIKLTPENR